MKSCGYDRDPYRRSWGYGSTKPFTDSVILKRDYRPAPKEFTTREIKSLLEEIINILIG